MNKCQATTKIGKLCSRNSLSEEKYCLQHLKIYGEIRTKKYKYLIGTTEIFELVSPKYKKHIYLFSDVHNRESKCEKDSIELKYFIEQIIQSTSKKIDFFLEYGYIAKDEEKRPEYKDNYLNDIGKYFKDCLTVKKTNCRFKNLRIHYADIRFRNNDNILEKLYRTLGSLTQNNNYDIDSWRDYLKLEFPSFWNNTLDYMKEFENIYQKSKINKQILSIQDQEISNLLVSYIDNEKIAKYEILKSAVDNFLGIKNLNTDEFREALNNIFNSLEAFIAILVDFYTLGRIFRDFIDKSSPNYILVYAGNSHIDNIREILLELEFEIIESSYQLMESNLFQCIDISMFTQPFFSKNFFVLE